MWIVKYVKSLIPEQLGTVNMLNCLQNCPTTLSPYCFITLAKVKLENVCFSVSETLVVFANTLSADVMYSLCTRRFYRIQFNCNYL